MGRINEIAKQLLATGDVKVIIGYGEGSNGNIRPIFVQNETDTNKLLLDERCTQNLAIYSYKKETVALGKPAIVSNVNTLRGIIRLAAENQLKDGDIIALAINEKGDITQCNTFDEIEQYLANTNPVLNPKYQDLIAKLDAMTMEERWAFWEKEMERCIRCYACRQACPLCYCTQCTVEVNRPQWISVGASTIGNLEWHIMRAMHLAGRCVECGQCGDACPVGIPIHLLPIKLGEEIKTTFGTVAGMKRDESCAMSTFKPDDKENFIG